MNEATESHSWQDDLDAAMKAVDQGEADALFARLVQHSMKRGGHSICEAESIMRENLGYYAGYFSHDTRERVERLYGAIHPIFGSASKGPPTVTEAFEAGLIAAWKARPDTPCFHSQCPHCHGRGVKGDGTICVHMISCPCQRCNSGKYATKPV